MNNLDTNVNDGFYKKIREKIRKWSETKVGRNHKFVDYLLFAPDLFHLLCKMSIDKGVPAKEKAKLAAAIAYFISPLDLMPEVLVGPVGFLDDIAVAAYVLNAVINNTDENIVKKHWAGDGDVLEVIQSILKFADEMIGSGLWSKIKKKF
ncbi:YkvA family protein [Dethiothermospora halolimnae]|uniref:YkvA family protein n=1 Tax=Dethiothermospora halolimnae TaxID=3114390 RepID=UPI003CCC442F